MKYEKKSFLIIQKFIYTVNFVLGNIPIFRENDKKITFPYKKIRNLYIASLFIGTIFCICYNEKVVGRFKLFKKEFNLMIVLLFTGVMGTIFTTCSNWIVSLTLSNHHKKIIYNNSKIDELLCMSYEKRRIPWLNEKLIIFMILISANITTSICASFKYLKNSNFSDVWFHTLIFAHHWFVMTNFTQQKINTHNLELINAELNKILKTQQSHLNVYKIVKIYNKVYENYFAAKYIISFPVNNQIYNVCIMITNIFHCISR